MTKRARGRRRILWVLAALTAAAPASAEAGKDRQREEKRSRARGRLAPADREALALATETARDAVAAGLRTAAAIEQRLVALLGEQGYQGTDAPAQARRIVREAVDKHRAREREWIGTTDCERLDLGLAAARALGVEGRFDEEAVVRALSEGVLDLVVVEAGRDGGAHAGVGGAQTGDGGVPDRSTAVVVAELTRAGLQARATGPGRVSVALKWQRRRQVE